MTSYVSITAILGELEKVGVIDYRHFQSTDFTEA